MRNVAILLVLAVLALLAWAMFSSSNVVITVNGEPLTGPARFAAEGWGVLVAVVGLACAAILLAFVFAGIGLIVLGVLVVGGLALVWTAFPFLLPLLVPLALVWLFVAAFRGSGRGRR